MNKRTPMEAPRKAYDMALLGQIGARVRHARLVRGMALQDVAASAQCSGSSVSRRERTQAAAALALLHRLGCALDSSASELTADEWPDTGPVLREGEHIVLS